MTERYRIRELWARRLDEERLLPEEESLLLEALEQADSRALLLDEEALDGALRGLGCSRRTAEVRARQVLDAQIFARRTEAFVGAVLARLPAPGAVPAAREPGAPRRRAIGARVALGATLTLALAAGAFALGRVVLPDARRASPVGDIAGGLGGPALPRFAGRAWKDAEIAVSPSALAPPPSAPQVPRSGAPVPEERPAPARGPVCPGLRTGPAAPEGAVRPALPGYRQEIREPLHGTRIIRVTGEPGAPIPGLPGARWSEARAGSRTALWTHQPWSADGSLLYLHFGGLFLDGESYAPLLRRSRGVVHWSPVEADILFVVSGNRILAWNVRADRDRELASLPGYSRLALHATASPSDDGRTLGILALRNYDRKKVCLLLDLSTGARRTPDIVFSERGLENRLVCASSPSGRFAVLTGRRAGGAHGNTRLVHDLEGKLVTVIEPSSESCLAHADLARDAAGEDLLVGTCRFPAAGPRQLVAVRLRDGITVPLGVPGGSYASGRATARPGWVYSSDTATGEVWAAEVETRRVERVGQVFSTRTANYWAQPMCVPSPDGRKVACASNWGDPGGRVDTYVVDIRAECL
jgi:hypothetical protein